MTPGADAEPRPALRDRRTSRSACSARPIRRAWRGTGPGPGEEGHEQLGAARRLRLEPEDQQPAVRQWQDRHPRRLRHRLRRDLLQPADRQRHQLPRIVTLDVTEQLEPVSERCSRAARRRSSTRWRPGRTRRRTPEPGEPLLQPDACSVSSAATRSRSGTRGSRGYKGINQIDENPATLTAEQAAPWPRRRVPRSSRPFSRGASSRSSAAA